MSASIPLYTVDAFSRSPFGGNPAAVTVLQCDQKFDDATLQKIALEMNLSETAFVQELDPRNTASSGSRFGLRWFTPTNEVDLCGHATLASACILFRKFNNKNASLEFETKSGILRANQHKEIITLDLPLADLALEVPGVASDIVKAMGAQMKSSLDSCKLAYSAKTKKLLVRLPDDCTRADLEALPIPNGECMAAVHDGSLIKGIIVTLKAPESCTDDVGTPYDFLSRYFAHWNGIPEDPVTGSAHTVLGNYWSAELSRNEMYARQCSKRGGDVTLLVDRPADRIYVGGPACIVVSGQFYL